MSIPSSVIAEVGSALGGYYYHHTTLNALFMRSGAPGEAPEGNCVEKCVAWLRECNADPTVDDLAVLGSVIEDYMDQEVSEYERTKRAEGQERIKRAFAKHGLTYVLGGTVIAAGSAGPTVTLQAALADRGLAAVETEVKRALATVEVDPPAALTAACALVEAVCKVYIEDEGLATPAKASLMPLWSTVAAHIGLDPAQVADDDVKRVLSGLTSVVHGIASLRTHAGSAHGRGRTPYHVAPRHARLAVNAAHTLASFVLETWTARQATTARR